MLVSGGVSRKEMSHGHGPWIFKTWTTFTPRHHKFQRCFLLPRVETGGQKNQTPQHDMSRTHCLTLKFGDGGVSPICSSRFEYFVHVLYHGYFDTFQVTALMELSSIHTRVQRLISTYSSLLLLAISFCTTALNQCNCF